MQTGVPASTKPPMVLLVIAIVLALIGFGGLASGAADDDSDDISTATPRSTTTTDGSSDTSSLVTVTTPTTGDATATTRKTTATTKGTATTQFIADCATSSAAGNPGAVKPPALGTYTYAPCGAGNKVDIVVTAGQSSGGVTRRNVSTQVEGNGVTAHNAYGPNGVTQESATILLGASVECDWNPDVVDYPAVLAVGTTWSVDSECTLGPRGKMKETGTRKITGVGSFVVGGTTVTGWLIDEAEKLVISGPAIPTTTFTSSRTYLFDPSRGVALYEKSVEEASGAVTQPKTTSERRLTNLTPKT